MGKKVQDIHASGSSEWEQLEKGGYGEISGNEMIGACKKLDMVRTVSEKEI